MPSSEEEESLPPGLALAWGLTAKSGRLGRKPSQSVEAIVAAAVALADEKGFEALSMPNIAKRLGLTANAVYRYVRSREELLVLLAETAWGPAPALDTGTGRWRAAAAAWTRAMIGRCEAHPWLPDLPLRGAPATPNLLRWTEVLLEALTGAGLSTAESLGCALLLDGYARRTATARRDVRESSAAPTRSATVTRFLQPLLHEHGYPILASMMSRDAYGDEVGEDDVDFGLNRILDGIEVLVARRADDR
ncbi:TetR/AcrR family transcriptional regulator [Streptomyces griseoaurantiacus]|uniref:TetR/AcrR family transcriptional regulator n=1 Tax=Streptomyces griseoaurantiacus TaxID=68213 RepID=UPI001780C83A|nr:TetR family transcriptional regulator [Streptomyces griseoaurantiacus]